jgi:hypothetical protein
MTIANITGLRCRARRQLRTHAGLIGAFSEGVIISEIDSLGRRLIEVQWDNEICVYVFPHEIEILDDIHPFACDSEMRRTNAIV